MSRTILAAIDADRSAKAVLDAARALAPMFDAEITAIHVGGGTRAAAARTLAAERGIVFWQASGAPAAQIAQAVDSATVAALAIGAFGGSGDRGPAGSTATELITRVRKPVLVIRPGIPTINPLERLLMPLDGSYKSSRALSGIISIASRRNLEIVALHVHSEDTVPAFSDHEPHGTRAWEREFVARHIGRQHRRLRLLRRTDAPEETVTEVARSVRADLIVLAWSQTLGAGRARVVLQTLASADVPVLLIPITNGSADG